MGRGRGGESDKDAQKYPVFAEGYTASNGLKTAMLRRWEARPRRLAPPTFSPGAAAPSQRRERNTSTDGGYLLLVAVWDCGIDGVETDLSLCLAHGCSSPRCREGPLRRMAGGIRKNRRTAARERTGLQKRNKAQIAARRTASLYCPGISDTLSSSVALSTSHSLQPDLACRSAAATNPLHREPFR